MEPPLVWPYQKRNSPLYVSDTEWSDIVPDEIRNGSPSEPLTGSSQTAEEANVMQSADRSTEL